MTTNTTKSTYGALPVTGFIRLADLRKILPVSDSTIWRRVRAGTMPAPVKLSEKVTAWRAEEIRAFLDQLGQAA
ncbi:helix-turn-helix transcriptional regulator [Chromobacterium vaccinii]|uniref:helix-turn-helix transcriptional regulator n=1 Tax=Chromobacterium vaccinii TaxID=1108595 RepID=UPI0031D67DFA